MDAELACARHIIDGVIDVDRVLLGYPEYARQARWEVAGTPIKPLWVMAGVLAFNSIMVVVFYKELKLTTFDAALASSLGVFRSGTITTAAV